MALPANATDPACMRFCRQRHPRQAHVDLFELMQVGKLRDVGTLSFISGELFFLIVIQKVMGYPCYAKADKAFDYGINI
jgi:hypothetical protein